MRNCCDDSERIEATVTHVIFNDLVVQSFSFTFSLIRGHRRFIRSNIVCLSIVLEEHRVSPCRASRVFSFRSVGAFNDVLPEVLRGFHGIADNSVFELHVIRIDGSNTSQLSSIVELRLSDNPMSFFLLPSTLRRIRPNFWPNFMGPARCLNFSRSSLDPHVSLRSNPWMPSPAGAHFPLIREVENKFVRTCYTNTICTSRIRSEVIEEIGLLAESFSKNTSFFRFVSLKTLNKATAISASSVSKFW